MRVLLIGGGGREHAIAWKLTKSKLLSKLYCIPGNAGIEKIAEVDNIPLTPPFDELRKWIREHCIDIVVVGPEKPLVDGINDYLTKDGVFVFGPDKSGALIEGSKSFAKKIMEKYHIPTAKYREFDNFKDAFEYVKSNDFPQVIKADGLAAGKGVSIVYDMDSAEKSLRKIMIENVFNMKNPKVVIEEFLKGIEASVLAITDGETILPFIPSQDHKPIYDGDKGPNTGGMGAYAPIPFIDKFMLSEIMEKILKPTILGLKNEGIIYKGVLYAGLMLTTEGPKVVEFNCRFGDPETQVVLPLLKNDLLELILAVKNDKLSRYKIENYEKFATCVILASKGYPGKYEKGKVIKNMEKIKDENVIIFHSGTVWKEGKLLTNGGRVLGITGIANSLAESINKAYEVAEVIDFENKYYRTDIGHKGLKYNF